jgi:uncharacterized protein (TIGR03382 family)
MGVCASSGGFYDTVATLTLLVLAGVVFRWRRLE